MGVSGTMEFLSDLLSSAKKGKKKKQMNTVSLKVRMDCEGCVLKVKKALSKVKGIYYICNGIPLLCYALQLIGIGLIFNLNKEKTDEMYAAMAQLRGADNQ